MVSYTHEPFHDKTGAMSVRKAKTQISLGSRQFWLRPVGTKDSRFLQSEDSDKAAGA